MRAWVCEEFGLTQIAGDVLDVSEPWQAAASLSAASAIPLNPLKGA